MIKKNQEYLNRLNAITDFLLVFLSYLFSAWFRLKVLHGWWENQGLSWPMIVASMFYAGGLLLMLSILGFYSSTRVRKLSWKIETLFISTTISIFIVTALIFIFKIEDVSRGIIVIFYVLTLVLLSGKQFLMQTILNQIRSSGFNIKYEVLVGNGRLSKQYVEDIEDEPELGIQIDETIRPTDNLEKLLVDGHIDEVVLALEPEEYGNITSTCIIKVPKGCCFSLSVEAVAPSEDPTVTPAPVIELQNANLVINRIA